MRRLDWFDLSYHFCSYYNGSKSSKVIMNYFFVYCRFGVSAVSNQIVDAIVKSVLDNHESLKTKMTHPDCGYQKALLAQWKPFVYQFKKAEALIAIKNVTGQATDANVAHVKSLLATHTTFLTDHEIDAGDHFLQDDNFHGFRHSFLDVLISTNPTAMLLDLIYFCASKGAGARRETLAKAIMQSKKETNAILKAKMIENLKAISSANPALLGESMIDENLALEMCLQSESGALTDVVTHFLTIDGVLIQKDALSAAINQYKSIVAGELKTKLFDNLKKMAELKPSLLAESDLYHDISNNDHLSALQMCVKADNGMLSDLAEHFLQIDGVLVDQKTVASAIIQYGSAKASPVKSKMFANLKKMFEVNASLLHERDLHLKKGTWDSWMSALDLAIFKNINDLRDWLRARDAVRH